MPIPLPETLIRDIDLSYPSNRYAVGGAAGVMLASLLTGKSPVAAGRASVLAFLAWAIARELDPDHPETATLTLPIAAVLAWMDGERSATQAGLDIAGAGAALAGLRYVTGTVGAVPTPVDKAALLAAAILSSLGGQQGAALLPALAPAVVQGRAGEVGELELVSALSALLPTVLAAPEAGKVGRFAALVTALSAKPIASFERIEAPCDKGNGEVSSERLQSARMMSLGAAALAALMGRGGTPAVLAAANLALGLRRFRG